MQLKTGFLLNSGVAIILPVFNKNENLLDLIMSIHELSKSRGIFVDLVIVDDGSNEPVERILNNSNYTFTLLNHSQNLGKGAALRTGMKFAMTRHHLIAYIDADLDLNVEKLFDAIDFCNNNAVSAAIGSKRHPLSTIQYPLTRKFLSILYSAMTRFILKVNLKDTQTGMKVFRGDLIELCLPLTSIDGFAFDLELLAFAIQLGYEVIEVPVDLNYQFSSTVTIKASLKAVASIFIIWKHLRTYRKLFLEI